MPRLSYNAHVLNRTLDLLRENNPDGLIEALMNTAYLIEQAVKQNIYDKNPLLYYDHHKLEPSHRAAIAMGKDVPSKFFSISLNEAIEIYLELDSKAEQALMLRDLREARNDIMHSIREMGTTPDAAGDISAKLLIEMKPLFLKVCGLKEDQIEVVTYEELKEQQKIFESKVHDELTERLAKHHAIHLELKPDVIRSRLNSKISFLNEDIFLSGEGPVECPACKEKGLDQITAVDFDWNPDGIITSASTWYECRVCELSLNDYELDALEVE